MNKPNHTDSSKLAFSLFLEMNEVAKPLEEIRTFLGISSASEDDVSFSSKLQRPFNWHFYNNKNSIAKNDLIPGQRTSEKRFASLLEKLKKYIEKCTHTPDRHNVEDLVEATGRIMHHIQDMSTPSHVVPVYHGPGLSDHYESYIESYAGKITPILVQSHHNRQEDDRMILDITREEIADAINLIFNDSADNPMTKLYETSARKTLKFLRDESISLYCNGKKESYALTSFWQEKNGTNERDGESFWIKILSDGFGSFGMLGNNFGKMTFTVNEKFFEGIPDEYLRIYKKLLKKTLIDSTIVLEYVARNSEIFSNPAFATQALSWN
jgi:spore cortex formation protein SpoVR/YcgB (stage V sporulation)